MAATSIAATAVPAQSNNSASQCGINALYTCIRYLGADLPLEQVYSDIPCDRNNGVNLYQLAQYARSNGFYVKAVRYPTLPVVKKYLTGKSDAILQVEYPNDRHHIVALMIARNGNIWVLDIPQDKFVASDEALGSLLKRSGGMLILSTTPVEQSIFSWISDLGQKWFFAVAILCIGGLISVTAALVHKTKTRTHTP